MDNNQIRRWIAVLAVSFIFISFGVWELIDPQTWLGFVPSFLATLSFVLTLVRIHGLILTILGLWFIWGKYTKLASILGTLVILDIVVELFISSGWTDLLVRDIGIMLLVLSFAFEKDR